MTDLVMQLRELEAAVDRVRRLHDNDQHGLLAPGKWCPGCGEEIPCRTIRALNGTNKAAVSPAANPQHKENQ